jgi:hypothetical protein
MPLVGAAYTDSSSDLPPLDSSSTDGIAAVVASGGDASAGAASGAAGANAAAANRGANEAKQNMTNVSLESNGGAGATDNDEDVCPICTCLMSSRTRPHVLVHSSLMGYAGWCARRLLRV